MTWLRNSETDIAGYKVYHGTNSGSYQVVSNVGNVTNAVVQNLTPGVTYYFTVTAYNTNQAESNFATEWVHKMSVATNAPPLIQVFGSVTAPIDTWTGVSSFRISDSDGALDTMTLDLRVNRGVMQFATGITGGLAANQITGNGSKLLRVQASMAAINNMLNTSGGLSYRGDLNLVGADTLSVTVTDGGKQGTTSPLSDAKTISIQVVGDNYDTWLNQRFQAADLVDPNKELSLYGENANPDGDEFDNLMEYALGLDPMVGNTIDGRLEFTTVPQNNNIYNALTHLRRKNQTILNYRVEVSADALTWTSGPGKTKQTEQFDVSSEFEAVTYQDQTAIQEGAPRFIRLTVEHLSP